MNPDKKPELPPEPKPQPKPAPGKSSTAVMLKDVYQGTRFRKGSKVTRKQLGDGLFDEWLKNGNIRETKTEKK